MPKIRGIKPDYWTDEDIVDLSVPARLLFIGLWTFACDNGHLQDKPKQIKMRIFPGDDVNATELLRELEAGGRIERGFGWITIPNLTEHQKPDRRYFTTCDKEGCEDPPEKVSQRESRRAHTVHTPGAQGVHDVGTPGAHVDGDGDGDGELKVSVKGDAAGKPATTRKGNATRLPADWKPTEKHWERRHDGIDVQREADKFRLHAEANDRRQVNWNASFSQWLLNARPSATPQARSQPRLSVAEDFERPPAGLDDQQYAAWDEDRRQRADEARRKLGGAS